MPRATDLRPAVLVSTGPGDAPPDWQRIAALGPRVRFLAVRVDPPRPADPDDRPSPGGPSALDGALSALRRAGVRTLGRVDAGLGRRSGADVLAEARGWVHDHGTQGVVLERVPLDLEDLGLVTGLVMGIRAAGARYVVLRPGGRPQRAHVDLADVTVTFEGPWQQHRWFVPPPWTDLYAPERLAHVVHAGPDEVDAVVARAVRLGVGTLAVEVPAAGDALGLEALVTALPRHRTGA